MQVFGEPTPTSMPEVSIGGQSTGLWFLTSSHPADVNERNEVQTHTQTHAAARPAHGPTVTLPLGICLSTGLLQRQWLEALRPQPPRVLRLSLVSPVTQVQTEPTRFSCLQGNTALQSPGQHRVPRPHERNWPGPAHGPVVPR